MATVIFYFTGTGNSLKIARDLAAELGDTELVPIARAITENSIHWKEAENIGFVFPVYFEGLPLIVTEFVKKLELKKAQYKFAIANCGGSFGTALTVLDRLLQTKDMHLDYGEVIKMPGNYIALYGAFPAKMQQKSFERESKQVKKIAAAVRTRWSGPIKKDNFLVNWLFSGLGNRFFAKNARLWDRSFYADERCNNCGICSRICPVKNITLKDGKPQWNHNCEQCFACVQWCPKESIQCGRRTLKRRRYHHPDIKVTDLY